MRKRVGGREHFSMATTISLIALGDECLIVSVDTAIKKTVRARETQNTHNMVACTHKTLALLGEKLACTTSAEFLARRKDSNCRQKFGTSASTDCCTSELALDPEVRGNLNVPINESQ